MATIWQTPVAKKYLKQIEMVFGMVLELLEQAYLGLFVNGLMDELKWQLCFHELIELGCVMVIA